MMKNYLMKKKMMTNKIVSTLENCEWCGQDLSELMSPNCQELCIDCTGETEWA